MPPKAASNRWSFRVPPEADQVVRDAASVSHRDLTEFVLRAATTEAERVLADRTRFVLDEPDWERFAEMLDRPVQDNPGLAKLFEKPTAFE